MRRFGLALVILITCSALYAGPVELYYNGKQIMTFYHEAAVSYSMVSVTSDASTKGLLFIKIEQNLNRLGATFPTNLYVSIRFIKSTNAIFQTVGSGGYGSAMANTIVPPLVLMPDKDHYGFVQLDTPGNFGHPMLTIRFDANLAIIGSEY